MPIRTDDARRWVEMDLVVPGTPDEVWAAVATGSGTSAWFVPTTIDGRVGGTVTFDMAEMGSSSATILEWKPPHRFAYEEPDWNDGAPPVVTEINVLGRSNSECLIRMAHRLAALEDTWDGDLESFERGWPGFFDVLTTYLQHFAGLPAANIHAAAACEGSDLRVWTTLTAALGLDGANVGEQREAPAGAPALAGVVEVVHQDLHSRRLLVRLSRPAPGVAVIGSFTFEAVARGAVSLFFYGHDAASVADAERSAWTAWMGELFTVR